MLLVSNRAEHALPVGAIRYVIDALLMSGMRYCLPVFCVCSQTEKEASAAEAHQLRPRVVRRRREHQRIAASLSVSDGSLLRSLFNSTLFTIQYHRIMSVHRLVTHRVPVVLSGTVLLPVNRLH